VLTIFKESFMCDGTEKPCKGKTPYRHISRGKLVYVDSETRKVHTRNTRETHPKLEQPAELVSWAAECCSQFLPTLLGSL